MQIKTQLVAISPDQLDPTGIAHAADLIRAGKLVAFPTETVYGLGADALNPAAVERIFAAKGRPFYDPLIVHIADVSWLERLAVEIPPIAWQLTQHFWPGPLTLVLRKQASVPDVVTAGGPTVAVRAPRHPIAQALLQAAATPIAAPSANRFSHTSPTTAQHVWDDLAGRIEMIVDGGPTSVGVESTVLDVTGDVPVLLRPGGVTLEALVAVVGEVRQRSGAKNGGENAREKEEIVASPGLLDTHYAPQADLWLFQGQPATVRDAFLRMVDEERAKGKRLGLLLTEEDAQDVSLFSVYVLGPGRKGQVVIESLGSYARLDEVAQRLFAAMRALDAAGVELMLAHEFPEQGLGLAINDRLRRAARQVIA